MRQMIAMISSHTLMSLFRYVLVGIVLFVIDLCVFLAAHTVCGVPTALSQTVSRATGATVGFLGHKRFTFQNATGSKSQLAVQSTSYVILTVGNVFLSAALVVVLELTVSWSILAIKVFAEVVMFIENFLVMKYIFSSRLKERREGGR